MEVERESDHVANRAPAGASMTGAVSRRDAGTVVADHGEQISPGPERSAQLEMLFLAPAISIPVSSVGPLVVLRRLAT
jgi:hypothetical protein